MIRLICLAAVFLSVASTALHSAVLSEMYLSVGGSPVLVDVATGNVIVIVGTIPSGFDANALPSGDGQHVSGTIGDWTVDLTGQLGVSSKLLTLDGVATSSSAGTLELFFTGTDFTSAPAAFLLSLIGTTTAPGYSITYDAFVDPTNSLPSTVLLGSLPDSNSGCSVLLPCTINTTSTVTSPITLTDPYSMTIHMTLTHTGAGTTTFTDPAISAVPEPTSLALLGTAVALAGIRRARNRG